MKNKFIVLTILLNSFAAQALAPSQPAEQSVFNSVVFLSIPAFDAQGSEVTGICNGTLIAKNILITAAHCVVNSKLFSKQPLKIEMGQYKIKQTPNGPVRLGYVTTLKHFSEVTVQLRPGVDPNTSAAIPPESDYAIVTLKSELPLPADFVFAKLWKQPLAASMITETFVVTINPIENIQNMDTKRIGLLNQIQFSEYSAKSTSTTRVQEGDSGAPLFVTVQGVLYFAGVVKGRAETYFSSWDVFAIWGNRIL